MNQQNPKSPHINRPIIISVALAGAIPSKAKFPALPTEPREIADQALLCAELGASVVHLHTRDKDGNQTQDLERLLSEMSPRG